MQSEISGEMLKKVGRPPRKNQITKGNSDSKASSDKIGKMYESDCSSPEKAPKGSLFFSDDEQDKAYSDSSNSQIVGLPNNEADPWASLTKTNLTQKLQNTRGRDRQNWKCCLRVQLQIFINKLKRKGYQVKSLKSTEAKHINIRVKREQENKGSHRIKQRIRRTRQQFQSHKQFDDFCLIHTKKMKFLSYSYGQTVYLHHKTLTHPSSHYQSTHPLLSTLIFSGSNFNNKPIFFGYILCRNANLPKYYKSLYIFIVCNLPKLSTLVIDEREQEILYAVRKIRDQFSLGFEICTVSYCRIREEDCFGYNYSQLITQYELYPQQPTICSYYLSQKQPLSLQQSPFDQPYHQNIISKLLQDNKNHQKPLINQFSIHHPNFSPLLQAINILDKYWSYTPHKKQKKFIPYKMFEQLCETLFRKVEQINQRWCLCEREGTGQDELKECRRLMSKSSYKVLHKQYQDINYLQIYLKQTNFYILDDGLSKYIVQLTEPSHFNCQCGLHELTGIPCSHILKILQHLNLPIEKSINPQKLCDIALIPVQ